MRRIASVILLFAFLALGSGTLSYLHVLEHASQDAAEPHDGPDSDHHHSHDENNCQYHALLRAPAIAAGWFPILALIGLLVALLRETPLLAIERFSIIAIDCRGPPIA